MIYKKSVFCYIQKDLYICSQKTKYIMHTQNIFVSILRELKIPFTSSFASLAYEEHPYKYTFYG